MKKTQLDQSKFHSPAGPTLKVPGSWSYTTSRDLLEDTRTIAELILDSGSCQLSGEKMLFVSSADKREYVRGNLIMARLLLRTTAAPPGGAEWRKHHTVIAQRLRSSSRSVTGNNRPSGWVHASLQTHPSTRSTSRLSA